MHHAAGPPSRRGGKGKGAAAGSAGRSGLPVPAGVLGRAPSAGASRPRAPSPQPAQPAARGGGPSKAYPPPLGLLRAPTSCPQPRGAGVNCPPACGPGRGSAPRPQGRREVEEPPACQSARRARPGNERSGDTRSGAGRPQDRSGPGVESAAGARPREPRRPKGAGALGGAWADPSCRVPRAARRMAWPDAGAQGLPDVIRGLGAPRPSGGAVLGGLAEAEVAPGAWSGGGGRASRGEKGAGCAALVGTAGSERGHFPGGKRRAAAPSPRPRPPPRVGRGPGGPRGRLGFFRQTRPERTDQPPRLRQTAPHGQPTPNAPVSELVARPTRVTQGKGAQSPTTHLRFGTSRGAT